MSFLIDENKTVLIQGITGREGSARARFMLEYGTKVVAGVTPGKKGENVWGIPVYDSVEEVVGEFGEIDISVTFIPGPQVKDAVIEAINAGVGTVVMPVERVPLHDTLEIISHARGTTIVGPGSLGIISPGKAVAGWLGGSDETAKEAFKAGRVAVISRSGGQTATVSWLVSKHGYGVSTAVHTGTEPVLGTNLAEYVLMANEDDESEAIVIFGEIGGIAEEETAEVMDKVDKPVIAYIAGAKLPSGIRFSHASAIIEGKKGSYESKREALENAGVMVVDSPIEIVSRLKEVLG
ncbi:Succinyl-CoA synthetase, alpha subunit [Archaeoglobus sulfaticallidus PM70-1]|uniref:acetate--CoA ligase (ADP-forming) n=1 Tax=Archaeoglobus sulfaticallidus PM70-1 TaxID=387631 RepID=N0BF48_9EURY|nr:CoA-binding protein [Archaeoglobus sulfaticallidus]AGK60897.1 Succinyl-CoA synthetase, alpha subunit [Archaeoglobus sulfaticallidus PM70-1]